MRKILVILLILLVNSTFAARYYVSNSGSNAADGLTPETAWQTLVKVNSFGLTPNPGDTISFKRGDTWKEIYYPNYTGNASNYIVVNAYGSGAKPIFTAVDTIPGASSSGSWTNVTGNIWSMSYTSVRVSRLWIDGVEVKEAETSTVTSTEPYYFASNTLYVYSVGNPYTKVITSGAVRTKAIFVSSGANYVKFEDLDVRGGSDDSFKLLNSDYITVANCNIGWHTSRNGLGSYISGGNTANSNWLVYDCIFDTGQTDAWEYTNKEKTETLEGVYLLAGAENWQIYDCQFYDWGHAGVGMYALTTGEIIRNIKVYNNYFDGRKIYYSRALGIFSQDENCGIEIYNNYIYSCSISNQLAGHGLKFYNNVLDMNNKLAEVDSRPYSTSQGISLQGGYGILMEYMHVFNNTVVNCPDWGIAIGAAVDDGIVHQNNIIENNIIVNCGQTARSDYASLWINENAAVTIGANTYRNNLIFESNGNDVWYGNASSSWGKTVAEFNALNGDEGNVISGNLSADPLFIGAQNYRLQSGSPAIDAGINTGLTTDIVGRTRLIQDIGAYEFYVPIGTSKTKYKVNGQFVKANGVPLAVPVIE